MPKGCALFLLGRHKAALTFGRHNAGTRMEGSKLLLPTSSDTHNAFTCAPYAPRERANQGFCSVRKQASLRTPCTVSAT
eukprot:665160-Pyramimonas_sp.AAC.3